MKMHFETILSLALLLLGTVVFGKSEDSSTDSVTILVEGMMKSQSGAT